jgi:DNA segregation ATPase FtsK/SpoIIIE, S-DNA-T family
MARAAAAKAEGTRSKDREATGGRGREVGGIVLLGVALFSGLGLCSLQFGKGNLMGPVGGTVALGLYALLGVGGYAVVWALAVVATRCLTGQPVRPPWTRLLAGGLGAFGVIVLLHLLLGSHRLRGHAPGGLVGEYGAELISTFIGRIGTGLVAAIAVLSAAVLMTSLSLRGATELMVAGLRVAGRFVWECVRAIFPERGDREDDDSDSVDDEVDVDDKKTAKAERRIHDAPVGRRKRKDDTETEEVVDADAEPALDEDEAAPVVPLSAAPIIVSAQKGKKARGDEAKLVPLQAEEAEEAQKPTPVIVAAVPPQPRRPKDKDAPKEPARAKDPGAGFIPAKGGYHLPSLELLDYEEATDAGMDKNAMLSLAERLQKTLSDYGVRGQVVQIHPGPVVTMYEVKLVDGTKLTKVTGLSSDLAMALEATSVRIVAPIPGKGTIGIEVPNKTRAKVYLKEILSDENVQKQKSKLTLGLGKDIAGTPIAVDLAKMPHLLVAGTTGSGKSVSVNGMICSMLFNATPEEVRMIMIDPKMVELSIYEGIPHLLLPVVTDPKKANLALKWAVDEMERRYELVSKSGVRDLVTYNKKVEKLLADGPPKIEDKKVKIYVTGDDGEKRELEVEADERAVVDAGGVVDQDVMDDISAARAANQKARELADLPPPRKLPYIVVVIDEFADLMMVAPKDIETSVARIAQKARAVGIHLIVATQRPSVDVITGLIKANFPSRIAFQVASKIDARTVLDQQGAESLLGHGDSLFSDRGAALRRVHGALVTEDEIKRMVDFLKEQGQPVYDMDILKPRADEDGEGELGFDGDESKDEFYDQAVRLVCETRMASVSMIQRRLQIGFNRAARLVEQMERDGIVGAANGSKPREVIANAI